MDWDLLPLAIIILGIIGSELVKKPLIYESTIWKKITEIFSLDLRALSIYRILISLTVIIDLIDRAKDLKAHYTDYGVMPRSALTEYFPYNLGLYIHFYTGTTLGISLIFLFTGLVAFLLMIGFYTKLNSILLWYLIVSLHFRNMIVCFGGDLLLHSMLLWSIFLPLGKYYSIESLYDKEKNSTVKSVCSLGSVLFIIQIFLVYFITTEFRMSPEWRTDYSAIYYALSYDLYLRPIGKWFLDSKNLELMKYMTFSVYWLERIGIFFIFSPIFTSGLRVITLILIVLMHIGINLCMNVGYFGLVSCVILVPLIPTKYMDIIDPFKGKYNISFKFNFPKNLITLISKGPSLLSWIKIPSDIKNILLIFTLSFMVIQNCQSVYPEKFKTDKDVSSIAKVLFLEQRWAMFIINTLKYNWWFVIPGKLEDGSEVNIFRNGKNVDWNKPPLILSTFTSFRWSVYLGNLLGYPGSWYTNLNNYGNYLCKEWNSTHPKNKQLNEFDVYYIFEKNLANYKVSPPQKGLVWKHFCFLSEEEKKEIWANIGPPSDALVKDNKYDEAIALLIKSITFLENRFGEGTVVTISPLTKLGDVYKRSGKLEESYKTFKKALEISERLFPTNQLFIAYIYKYLSEVSIGMGNVEEGSTYLGKYLSIMHEIDDTEAVLSGSFNFQGDSKDLNNSSNSGKSN